VLVGWNFGKVKPSIFSFLFLCFYFSFFANGYITHSLGSTIHFQRPDLLFHTNDIQIPLNPPLNYFAGFFPSPLLFFYFIYFFFFFANVGGDIPDVGQLMFASFPVDPKVNVSIMENNTWYCCYSTFFFEYLITVIYFFKLYCCYSTFFFEYLIAVFYFFNLGGWVKSMMELDFVYIHCEKRCIKRLFTANLVILLYWLFFFVLFFFNSLISIIIIIFCCYFTFDT
jgi:hypothetical protein